MHALFQIKIMLELEDRCGSVHHIHSEEASALISSKHPHHISRILCTVHMNALLSSISPSFFVIL